ncbi:protein trichome birefringence-like 12 [Salvia hispanica]|uniref:protein trichome birefringence-like 12 n=1 Tax=Salvia hispanica TaxID=49212 RepID=UPI0020092D50|nr:protein trichome birefringence-like 12 [Salvia hispanica]
MASKLSPKLIICLILPSCFLILFHSFFPLLLPQSKTPFSPLTSCNLSDGRWILDPTRKPTYDSACPFHRNAWNCLKNQRANMARINSWKWSPHACDLDRVDPVRFLNLMRDRSIGLIGDSLNENFLVAFLCVLRLGDAGARKWKRRGAWRGAYFPKFNVTVAYHRAVLLARYEWQTKQPGFSGQDGVKGIYRADVDIPADDWANVSDFYDVLVFNTGHWWGPDKFPEETPLVFFKDGQPIHPPLDLMDGLKVVVKNMVSHIEKAFPKKTLKFWRLQSPRHFHGGDWNQNGSCLFDNPLEESEIDLWFDPANNGTNKEGRIVNEVIGEALKGTSIIPLDLSRLSEWRADAHPAVWLGKKDAVAVWGQDCMHWCLPGVPDTWVDILAQLITYNFTPL